MYQVTFNLETITPLFMAGADGDTPELRPSSFKGMMRFWWRAMQTEDNIEVLAASEARIFGGTSGKKIRSRIAIRIVSNELRKNRYSPLPHKQVRFSFPAIEPRQTFQCVASVDEEHRTVAMSTLRLSLLLGGFGKRSRRGFGALAYRKFRNIDDVIEEIEAANSALSDHVSLTRRDPDGRTVLLRHIDHGRPSYPRILEIHIGHKKGPTDSILKKIGNMSHLCRDNALGTVRPRRMASPVIATVVRIKEEYYPVLTKLTSHFPPSVHYNSDKQDEFINRVLK